jgi:hypothetical protein
VREREAGCVIFGDAVRAADAADTVTAAQWIAHVCDGAPGTVGWWVPATFASYARIHAPEPGAEWWAEYRSLHATVAEVAERHTSTPDAVWFAVWEGHGWDTATTHIAWNGPLDDETRAALDAERARLRDEDVRRNRAIRAALDALPAFETFSFDAPFRHYFLLRGPVAAATRLDDPASPGSFQRPDLWWPDDRRWFVATDTDFWSLYVGGSEAFVDELASSVPTLVERCGTDFHVEPED